MTRERFVKTLNTFTVDSLLTVTSIRRKTRWTNISSWSLPFFAPFIWLSVRRTSLLDDHLVLILKVSVVEMVDYIFIQNLTINYYQYTDAIACILTQYNHWWTGYNGRNYIQVNNSLFNAEKRLHK